MGQNIPLADNGKRSILGTSLKVKKRVVSLWKEHTGPPCG
jgi:hypothetical protein